MSDKFINSSGLQTIINWIKTKLAGKQDTLSNATDSTAGIVKTNSSESVTLNANGQLDVGGRLGAFSGTTGIFHTKDREPRNVGDYSLLITDAVGMNLTAPRDIALATGVNLTLTKSHAAGSTTYTVANNYVNRISCAVLANGGYVSQNEAYSKENQIVPVTSVKINGSSYTPNSSADDSSKPITITTETSANPTSAVTALRVFGGITGGYCSEYVGQCVGGTNGASLAIGQRVYSTNNVNCIVAADVYNTGNGNAIFGRQHISRKNRSLLAGTGHDTTNAKSESVAAFGEWSDIGSTTAFVIGNGTSATNRKNLFEIRTDGTEYFNGSQLATVAKTGNSSDLNNDAGFLSNTLLVSHSESLSIAANSFTNGTITISQTGYKPVAIAGFEVSGTNRTYVNISRLNLNPGDGEVTFTAATRASSAFSGTMYVKVLWVK